MEAALSRRRFLRQSFAFSALASLHSLPSLAAPANSAATNLLMVGDWGYENFAAQAKVAAAMQAYAKGQNVKPDALLMLGDNWYGSLPGGVDSARWKTQFEDMYPKAAFDCPAYAILGNHDYQRMPDSKVDANLAYAKKPGGRWTMPARWYSFDFPAAKPVMTVVALDSNMPFANGTWDRGLDFTLKPAEQAEQLAWLEGELKKPRTTPFVVVMGHHPIYSNGIHGDHKVLIRDWDPLFRKYKVDLYLAGHDHDMQHLEFEGHPTSFALSGGGGADLYTLVIAPGKRGPMAEKIYGFSHLEASADRLLLRHIDETGRTIHAFSRDTQGKVAILS